MRLAVIDLDARGSRLHAFEARRTGRCSFTTSLAATMTEAPESLSWNSSSFAL